MEQVFCIVVALLAGAAVLYWAGCMLCNALMKGAGLFFGLLMLCVVVWLWIIEGVRHACSHG